MKYIVQFSVEASFEVSVDADSIDEALKKAESCFSEADPGDFSNVDGEVDNVTDENGHWLYPKLISLAEAFDGDR